MSTNSPERNPEWTEAELTVALATYFNIRDRGEELSASNPRIDELSKTLSSLDIHPFPSRTNTFRHPAGVLRRIRYFKQLEAGVEIKKRHAYRQVWEKYKNAAARLQKDAAEISKGVYSAAETLVPEDREALKQEVSAAQNAPTSTKNVTGISEWWAGDPTERYWLEITDRTDLGDDLHAPKSSNSGKETWSYSLVSHVKDGDIVFHYWKQAGQVKAIVGHSRATGALESNTIRWQSHGTYGRAAEPVKTRPAWRFPLSDFKDLPNPVSLAQLRSIEPQILSLSKTLAEQFKGPLYLPFVFSSKRPLRTAQGYLAKLPATLVRAIPELAAAAQVASQAQIGQSTSTVKKTSVGGTGYQSDPDVRGAIERHAVDWTMKHFRKLGYLVEDVGSTHPYDVRAMGNESKPPNVELHIEVKGSAGTSTTVQLTAGEVKDANTGTKTASVLVVLDQIQWSRSPDGVVTTLGGRPRLWWDWLPEEERLTPTDFRYLLPSGAETP